jgi:L,D-peptidoglycan transpeptidase YkuD (ErfK/YbiS/YcfS/YnhG family)
MRKILVMMALFAMGLYAQPIDTRQLLVVTTKGWNSSIGSLQRYEKGKRAWHKVGSVISVKLGRNGLGWGRGLHAIPKGAKIIKREGDGRAPAGVFELKQAFGYAPFDIDYPYATYSSKHHCVDDSNSKLYNKIVDSSKVQRDYQSHEVMKFPKNYYKYGIVVNHNHIDEQGAVAMSGSCIFLHIKSVPTAGCTVMRESQIKELMRWLRKDANPILIQGTTEVVNQLLKKHL